MDDAVFGLHPGLLGQHRLRIDGGHAEEGDDPHPEDGAGAADQDGAAGANDVAGAYLGCHGGGQGLEGAEAALLPPALQTEAAEKAAPALLEAAQLHEAGPDGEEESRPHQKEDQNIVREVSVDGLYELEHRAALQ